ncbi:MAG: hypothetical protein GTN81_00160 [Proteobacteria bacterium]|nr:hypothetical protein [Pseudomonadota bacterium]
MISFSWALRFLVFSVVLVGGCSLFSTSPSLPGGYLIPQKEPPSTPISRRVYLVADNQIHNLYNKPIPLLRTEFADKLVQSAIRPVQLDFYGQDFLEWLVRSRGQRTLFVHVGDAADFSCTGEFRRFVEIMGHAKKGWVLAPGNHEGFFLGNDHRDVANGDWPAGCSNAGKPMTKNQFVRLYLAALVLQKGPGYRTLARHLNLDGVEHTDLERIAPLIPIEGDWRYGEMPGEDHPFLRAVSWRIDAVHPWRSFVVQELDLSRDPSRLLMPVTVRAILLDTAQYKQRPILLPPSRNAGLTGELLDDQIAIVDSWIDSGPRESRFWLLIGHHPFDRLTPKAQDSVDALRKSARADLYVSAHTHAGQFIVHGKDSTEENWLELNVGSILDWSLEFRPLQLSLTDDGERLLLRSPRYTMHEWLQEFEGVPLNDEEWEAKPGDLDYYLGHEDLKDLDAHDTEIRLKNVLLAAHGRLLLFNPTRMDAPPDAPFWPTCCASDETIFEEIERLIRDNRLNRKIEFLLELGRFEADRPVEDPDRRRKFRLSQAIWASKYDSVHFRKPLKEDLFIIFPEE